MAADFKQLQKIVQEYAQAGYGHIRVKDGEQEIEVSDLNQMASRQTANTNKDDELALVTSPMVGIFHLAEQLSVGTVVQKGQELGQLESMKLFNPVNSPIAGRITKIPVDSNQPVEFQQLLVEIRKEG